MPKDAAGNVHPRGGIGGRRRDVAETAWLAGTSTRRPEGLDVVKHDHVVTKAEPEDDVRND